ncbi:hypothetical protein AK88_05443 [Plasmodium fragile]|uniref:Schizont-infected cell agglutination extracellular alpha domain-containing protein n=1 Tax=Plasmodium fragile TaxID=5857 RepID=A0A0D9QD32_PLAFR|nr:uncharacterized protein AK88_05443 [Plasmodium fragile]KJP84923.1 hypothetical protein AK88_05443 [Plasmodium fragile]
MSAKQLGALLVEYVRSRGVYMSGEEYQNMLLKDIYNQLREFVVYMEKKENIILFSVNCDDHGWWHEGAGIRQMNTPGNIPICRLMVGALYFMNNNKWKRQRGERADTADDRLKDYVGCAIVNMFEELLLEASCGANWGIEQAWYIMRKIEAAIPGLITDKICNLQQAENIQIGKWSMKDKIKKWLDANEKFKAKLQVQKVGKQCTGNAKSTSKDERASTALSEGHASKIKQTKSAEKILWGRVKTVVREARKEVRHQIKEMHKNKTSQHYANVTRGGEFIDISDPEDDDDDEDDEDAQEEDVNGKKSKGTECY